MASRLVFSVSGKGGTGKTTLTALLLKWIICNTDKVALVVDADPATNLPDVLGVKLERTVGAVSKEMKEKIEQGVLSPAIPKRELLEGWVFQTLVEEDRFDLLAMGRSEGEGCYCFVNNVLTRILDILTGNYAVTLMDMEAGLEHLSRRTDRNLDGLLIVTDPSRMGFETAKRIKDLAGEVHIGVKRIYLVGNQFTGQLEATLREAAEQIGLELAGSLPVDPEIMSFNILGKPLLNVPDDSPAYRAVDGIARKIGLDRIV